MSVCTLGSLYAAFCLLNYFCCGKKIMDCWKFHGNWCGRLTDGNKRLRHEFVRWQSPFFFLPSFRSFFLSSLSLSLSQRFIAKEDHAWDALLNNIGIRIMRAPFLVSSEKNQGTQFSSKTMHFPVSDNWMNYWHRRFVFIISHVQQSRRAKMEKQLCCCRGQNLNTNDSHERSAA